MRAIATTIMAPPISGPSTDMMPPSAAPTVPPESTTAATMAAMTASAPSTISRTLPQLQPSHCLMPVQACANM
jgi:hypothetical protein